MDVVQEMQNEDVQAEIKFLKKLNSFLIKKNYF